MEKEELFEDILVSIAALCDFPTILKLRLSSRLIYSSGLVWDSQRCLSSLEVQREIIRSLVFADAFDNAIAPAMVEHHKGLRELIVEFPLGESFGKSVYWDIMRQSSNQIKSVSLSGDSDQVAAALELFQSGGALESLSVSFNMFFGELDLDPLIEVLQRVGKRLKFLEIRRANSKLIDSALFAASKHCSGLTHLIIDADCTLGALRAVTHANKNSLRVLRAPVLNHHSFKFQDIWKPFRDSDALIVDEINEVSLREFCVPLERLYGPGKNKFWESLMEYRMNIKSESSCPILLDEMRGLFKVCHPVGEPLEARARALQVAVEVVASDAKNRIGTNADFLRVQFEALMNMATGNAALPCSDAILALLGALSNTAILDLKDSTGDTLNTGLMQVLIQWINRDSSVLEWLPSVSWSHQLTKTVFTRNPSLLKRLFTQRVSSSQSPLAFSYARFPEMIVQALGHDYQKLFIWCPYHRANLFQHMIKTNPSLREMRILVSMHLKDAFDDEQFCVSLYEHRCLGPLKHVLSAHTNRLDKIAQTIWQHTINNAKHREEVKQAALILTRVADFGSSLAAFVKMSECLYDLSSSKFTLQDLQEIVSEAIEAKSK